MQPIPISAPAIPNLSAEDQAKLAAFDGHRIKRIRELVAKIKPFLDKLTPAVLDNIPELIAVLKGFGVVIAPGEDALLTFVVAILKALPKAK